MQAGQLVVEPITVINSNQTYINDNPPLYVYDLLTNSSHLVTIDEAKKFNLDPGPSSPDGYTINYRYYNSGIFELFGSDNRNQGYYIGLNGSEKRLDGLNSTHYYGDPGSFKLIGWIK